MSDSTSPQGLFPDPPVTRDDPAAWGEWAEEFLGHLCRKWAKWRQTWELKHFSVPEGGDPYGQTYLERAPHTIRSVSKLVWDPPPSWLPSAAPLLDALSGAVLRFRNEPAWKFEPVQQADEVAERLLEIKQHIESERYALIPDGRVEQLGRQVTVAIRRGRSAGGRDGEACTEPRGLPLPATPPTGEGVGESGTDPGNTPPTRDEPGAAVSKDGTPNVTASASRRPRAKRGRKPNTDPKADARIAEAWATGEYQTLEALGRELKLEKVKVRRALDRHRKRKKPLEE